MWIFSLQPCKVITDLELDAALDLRGCATEQYTSQCMKGST